MNDDILLNIGADTKQFTKAIDDVEKQFNNLNKKLGKNHGQTDVFKAMRNSAKGFAEELSKVEEVVERKSKSIKKKLAEGLKFEGKLTKEQESKLDSYYKKYMSTLSKIERERLSTEEKVANRQKALANAKFKRERANEARRARKLQEQADKEKAINNAKFKRELANIRRRERKEVELIAKKRKMEEAQTRQALKNQKKEALAEQKHDKETFQRKMALYKKELAEKNKANRASGGWGAGGTGGNTSFLHKVNTTAQYTAAATAIYAVAGAARYAAEESIKYDNALYNNMAVLNITRAESEKLLDSNRKVAIQYGMITQELDQAAITLGRAGVAYNNLAEATKVTAQLSKITGDSLDDSSKVVSSFTLAFNLASEEVGRLGNQLAYAANASKLSIEDLGTMANYALSGARALGLTKEAVLALATSFSNVGVNASTIGTQIRKIGKLFRDTDKHSEKFFATIEVGQEAMVKAFNGEQSDEAFAAFVERVTGLTNEAYEAATKGMPILTKQMLDTLRITGDNMVKHFDKIKDGGDDLAAQSAIQAMSIESMWNSTLASIGDAVSGYATSIADFFTGRDDIVLYTEMLKYLVKDSKEYNEVLKKRNELVGDSYKTPEDSFGALPKTAKEANAEAKKLKKTIEELSSELATHDKLGESSWAGINEKRQKAAQKVVDKIQEQSRRLEEVEKILLNISKLEAIGLEGGNTDGIVSDADLKRAVKLREEIELLRSGKGESKLLALGKQYLEAQVNISNAGERQVKLLQIEKKIERELIRIAKERNSEEKKAIAYSEKILKLKENIAAKEAKLEGRSPVESARSIVASRQADFDGSKTEEEALTNYNELLSARQALKNAIAAEERKSESEKMKAYREQLATQRATFALRESNINLMMAENTGINDTIERERELIELRYQSSKEMIESQIEGMTGDEPNSAALGLKYAKELNDNEIKYINDKKDLKEEERDREIEHAENMLDYEKQLIDLKSESLSIQLDGTDALLDSLDTLSSSMSEGLNNFTKGLSGVGKALTEQGKKEIEHKKKVDGINTKYAKNTEKLQKKYEKKEIGINEYQLEMAKVKEVKDAEVANAKEEHNQNQLGMYSQIAGSIGSMYEEGSSGAKAMMQAQQALAIVEAGIAVANAGQGDPYTAIPRAIAMAGLMAQFVEGFSGGGSGDGGYSQAISDANYQAEEANAIVDELERQTEVLETIANTEGTIARYEVGAAEATLTADMSGIWAELLETSEEMWRTLTERGHINVTDDAATNVQSSIDFLRGPLGPTREAALAWLQIGESDILELENNMKDAVHDFGMNIADVAESVSDASQSFKDIYDELSGLGTYAKRDLQEAFNLMRNSLGSTSPSSLLGYLEDAIAIIDTMGDEYAQAARDILLTGTEQEKIEALRALSIEFDVTFEGGVEDALNYLDAVEMVSEAMVSSKGNIQSFADSFMDEEQLARKMATSHNIELADSMDELIDLTNYLSGGLDGLTDSELELLEANKALLDTEMDEYIDSISESISTLEGVFSSLESTIEKLRGESDTSAESLDKFRSMMNIASDAAIPSVDDYNDMDMYNEAVAEYNGIIQDVIDSSSVLFNTDPFASASEMKFEQLLSAMQMEDIGETTSEEINHLRQIEENTSINNALMLDLLRSLGAKIDEALKDEIMYEQWNYNTDTGVANWNSTGGATAQHIAGVSTTITSSSGTDISAQDAQAWVSSQIEAGNYNSIIDTANSFGMSAASTAELMGVTEQDVLDYADLVGATSAFAFAEGGIVTSPTMGLIGEAGYDEAVIPLKDPNDPLSMGAVTHELGMIKQLMVQLTASNERILTLERASFAS